MTKPIRRSLFYKVKLFFHRLTKNIKRRTHSHK